MATKENIKLFLAKCVVQGRVQCDSNMVITIIPFDEMLLLLVILNTHQINVRITIDFQMNRHYIQKALMTNLHLEILWFGQCM